jgi:flagellar motor switch protein FliM
LKSRSSVQEARIWAGNSRNRKSTRIPERAGPQARSTPAVRFDFRRPDRIPKSQVRAIHLLHDTFVRNLVSSLSAYLRSYLAVNLVSVEQLSYAEFLDGCLLRPAWFRWG